MRNFGRPSLIIHQKVDTSDAGFSLVVSSFLMVTLAAPLLPAAALDDEDALSLELIVGVKYQWFDYCVSQLRGTDDCVVAQNRNKRLASEFLGLEKLAAEV
jgi:hypothetical protein